ncbi:late histone H2B.L4-like [Daphnia pulex]|uniref:late histone H2B.L4-like n=1 Tax=Daphnia pulex TaxID=6669 RepID=UPI001EDEA2B5|nr:late histone H2B.L4-like [Daphnia pulex]
MARKKKQKGVGSVEKNIGTSTVNYRPPTKRRRSQQPVRFSRYVFKVLKQVHPQLSMTNKAMKDDFMHDIYSRLVSEAAGLLKLEKRSTLSTFEFQTYFACTSLRFDLSLLQTLQTIFFFTLAGELAKHAMSEASKAVTSFSTSRRGDAERSEETV